MVSDQHRTIRRILRVNHSGEHGAISIYSAQITRARQRYPELLPWLEETLSHEIQHRKTFADAMPSRGAKPCRAMFIWKYGGATLGLLTSLFGKFGIMVCTAAVERTVHRHLIEQIHFLENTDADLAAKVKEILKEEDQHLRDAERQHDQKSIAARMFSTFVSAATETLIFISTRGDSRNLKSHLRLDPGSSPG